MAATAEKLPGCHDAACRTFVIWAPVLLRLLALLAHKLLAAETQQGQTSASESAPANES